MEAGTEARRTRPHGARYVTLALFEPDTLVPSQWYGARGRTRTPEEHLMLAVLDDALHDLTRFAGIVPPHHRYADARAYLLATDRRWLYSAANICDTVGIDHAALVSAVETGRVDRRSGQALRVVSHRPTAGDGKGCGKVVSSPHSPRWVA